MMILFYAILTKIYGGTKLPWNLPSESVQKARADDDVAAINQALSSLKEAVVATSRRG